MEPNAIMGPMDRKRFNNSIKEFSRKSNARGLASILKDIAAIGMVAYLNIRFHNVLLYMTSIWIIGAFQFAMSESLLHEASHWNLFRSRKLNDLAEIAIALPFFQTMRFYRAEHRMHHVHILQKEDNLTAEYRAYGIDRPDPNMFWIWFVKPFVGYGAIMMAHSTPAKSDRKDWIKIASFWCIAMAMATYYGCLEYVALYWLIPLTLCKGPYLYWSEISDHYRTRSGFRTRTGTVSNFIFHNNGYHHAHHRYPSITHFNLKRAHALQHREGDDVSSGFFETYRQIRSG